MYILKQNIEAFRVVDGPFAGRRYRHGVEYAEVPPEETHKFEMPVKPDQTEKQAKKQKKVPKGSAPDHTKYEK